MESLDGLKTEIQNKCSLEEMLGNHYDQNQKNNFLNKPFKTQSNKKKVQK